MSVYRYLVFPRGIFPTQEEVEKFRSYYDLLDRHVAYGICREDTGLAIACEALPFDHLLKLDPEFNELLVCWQVRGGKVVERLSFSKNMGAWKSIPAGNSVVANPKSLVEPPPDNPKSVIASEQKPRFTAWMFGESLLAKKKSNADEALALALALALLKTNRRYSLGEKHKRLATHMPYVLWAMTVLGIAFMGYYLASRLQKNPLESRQDTIERVSKDPMRESLSKQST